MALHDYQLKAKSDTYEKWEGGAQNVLLVLPTGGGKTFTFTDIMKEHRRSIAIAHRQELVSQMSLTLGIQGIRHRVVAPDSVIRETVKLHMDELGRSFFDPNSHHACAGVDTLINRDEPWFNSVDMFVIDEGHHVLKENKWGKAASMFPNARGLGVTATPIRADGKGLGRHAHGIFDSMVEGPTGEDLIQRGFLCGYKIACPKMSIDRDSLSVTASGDFSPSQLRTASAKSKIVGDVVESYVKYAYGKLGITFAVSVEDAARIAEAFNNVGVPAQVVTAQTPTAVRALLMRKFRERKILMLVNVDLFGEGTDVPALEVVIMGRPTESYSLYSQQFGRVLRRLEGKTHGWVLDHVGNVVRHGLPTTKKKFTLDAREARSKSHPSDGEIPMRTCPECTAPYPRVKTACPFCEHVPEPGKRGGPQQVDGDLELLDEETLAKLRGEIVRVDSAPYVPVNATPDVAKRIQNLHYTRNKAQGELRQAIAQWAGWRVSEGYTIRESQKLFYITFGVDVLSAQALNIKDADELKIKVVSADSFGVE